jgi:hypothetical protein
LWQLAKEKTKGPRLIFTEDAKRVNLELRDIKSIISTRQERIMGTKTDGPERVCMGSRSRY